MLKLELSSQRDELIVSFRSRESVWTPSFLAALSFALALHLAAALLIRVDDQENARLEAVLPLHVYAELGGERDVDERSTSSMGHQEGLLPPYVLEPKAPLPAMPSFPQQAIDQQFSSTKRLEQPGRIFAQIEESPLIPEALDISLPRSSSGHASQLTITLSGAAAEATLLRDGSQGLSGPDLARFGDCRVVVAIAIDPPTGTVLWAKPLSEQQWAAATSTAQHIVQSMVFARAEGMFPIEGLVELRFHGGKSEEPL